MYFYRIYHGPDTLMKVRFNDIVVYHKRDKDADLGRTTTNSANDLLFTGENSLTIEIVDGAEHHPVFVDLNVDYERTVKRVDWPGLWEALPEGQRVLPMVHTAHFDITEDFERPAFLNAPKSDFGPEGNPELREAVRKFHDAVDRCDLDSYCESLDLKSEELLRSYNNHSDFTIDGARQEAAGFFQQNPRTRPLDFDELVFESCRGGQVAYVRRVDGGKAIESVGAETELSTDLWLTRHRAEWKIFR